jgi:hypothetical protein
MHTCGPQIDRIVTKLLKLLPTLESTGTKTVVDFYDHLQESTTGLTIAIMLFDSVMIWYGLEGLCVPGLGVDQYHLMSKSLMELLPRLIPSSISPQINAALASVWSESGNGYDYLWRVLELTVPRFNPVVPLQAPQWSNSDNIFSFAQAYLLQFRLQGKMHFHYGDRTRSRIFLRAIEFSNFADMVTTLQSHVNLFQEPFNDDYLPPHLRIHGLATSIHQNIAPTASPSIDDLPFAILPSPEPPPRDASPFPPDSLFDVFSRPVSPHSVTINLRADQEMESVLAQLPTIPSILDSVHTLFAPHMSVVSTGTLLWSGPSLWTKKQQK